MKKFIGIIALATLLILPVFTLAQDPFVPEGGTGSGADFGGTGSDTGSSRLPNLLGVNSAEGLLNKILDWLIKIIAPILLTIMVIIGAFQMLFAQGNAEKFSAGRKTIVYAVIGYAIIFISQGVALIIKSAF